MELRYCKKCDSQKPLTKEHWHKRKSRKDGWEFYCKSCVKKTTLANYNKNKKKWNETTRKNKALQRQRINEYKDSKCCVQCGESRNWVLDFHHPDPKEKEFQIFSEATTRKQYREVIARWLDKISKSEKA